MMPPHKTVEDASPKAQLTRLLGAACAADVLAAVDAFRKSGAAHHTPRYLKRLSPAHRNYLRQVANHAEALAAALRQGLSDDPPLALVAEYSKWRARQCELSSRGDYSKWCARQYELSSRGDVRAVLAGMAEALDDLRRWAADDLQELPTTARGIQPRVSNVLALNALVYALHKHRQPLSRGDGSKLVRAARIAWPLFGLVGDPRETLRSALKSGHLHLPPVAD